MKAYLKVKKQAVASTPGLALTDHDSRHRYT